MGEESKGMPGWDAINAALRELYDERKPLYWGTVIPSYLGGPDPLDGLSAYKVLEPTPHWHIIGMGLSELFGKESSNAEVSGFGYEFTFRLACDPQDERPPNWALNLMQNLARAATRSGIVFGPYHTIDANGPIAVGDATKMTAAAFVPDPKLSAIDTPHGSLAFLQIVGITADELGAMRDWSSRDVLELIAAGNPLLVTDLRRASITDDPSNAAAIESGIARGGSSSELDVSELRWRKLLLRNKVEVAVGALIVPEILRRIRNRTLRERPFIVANGGERISLIVSPGDRAGWEMKDRALEMTLTRTLAEEMLRTLRPARGHYAWDALANLSIKVEPSEIRDEKGRVTEVRG